MLWEPCEAKGIKGEPVVNYAQGADAGRHKSESEKCPLDVVMQRSRVTLMRVASWEGWVIKPALQFKGDRGERSR